jgi:hypothetical protein
MALIYSHKMLQTEETRVKEPRLSGYVAPFTEVGFGTPKLMARVE